MTTDFKASVDNELWSVMGRDGYIRKVSPIILQKLPYFLTFLESGMAETGMKEIRKENWTPSTLDLILSALESDSKFLTVPLNELPNLLIAADEILFDGLKSAIINWYQSYPIALPTELLNDELIYALEVISDRQCLELSQISLQPEIRPLLLPFWIGQSLTIREKTLPQISENLREMASFNHYCLIDDGFRAGMVGLGASKHQLMDSYDMPNVKVQRAIVSREHVEHLVHGNVLIHNSNAKPNPTSSVLFGSMFVERKVNMLRVMSLQLDTLSSSVTTILNHEMRPSYGQRRAPNFSVRLGGLCFFSVLHVAKVAKAINDLNISGVKAWVHKGSSQGYFLGEGNSFGCLTIDCNEAIYLVRAIEAAAILLEKIGFGNDTSQSKVSLRVTGTKQADLFRSCVSFGFNVNWKDDGSCELFLYLISDRQHVQDVLRRMCSPTAEWFLPEAPRVLTRL